MARIIDERTSLDLTVKIFDDFYSFNMIVNGNEYDIVNGYFKTVCDTKNIAGNFTAFLFRISQETGIPVLDLLNQIQGTGSRIYWHFWHAKSTKTKNYPWFYRRV